MNDIERGRRIVQDAKYAPPLGKYTDESPPEDFADEHRNGVELVADPYADVPPPTEPPDDDDTGEYDNEGAVLHRLQWLRVNHEARRRLDDENRPPIILPPVKNLETLLREPDTPTRYRIEDVAPERARIMLSAQSKAGKTTIRDNLMRSLTDGDPFLGRFTVHTPAECVVLIDDEMSEDTLRRWLRDQAITNTVAVADVIALRGRVGAFNLLDDRCRDRWAERLRDLGCDYLVLDCLRPCLDALGLDESRDAGRFLVAYDALIDEAGISDSAIVHHMGHTGERARGDSRLQDWPDAIWRVVRETDEPSSTRYFSAYGRDVDVREGRLAFDPSTRRLTYAPGSRSDAKTEAAKLAAIQVIVQAGKPLSKNSIEKALADAEEHTQTAVRAGLAQAVKNGLVTVADGPRRAKLCSISYPCSECGMPVASHQERHQECPSGLEGLFDV